MGALAGFLEACRRGPDRPALEVAGTAWTYEQLYEHAAAVAATLQRRTPEPEPRLTAVFAARSPTAYAGIVASLLRGHGYVPLSRRYPVERTRSMLLRAGCHAIVADSDSAGQLPAVLDGVDRDLLIVLPDLDAAPPLDPRHRVVTRSHLAGADAFAPVEVAPDDLAYLIFTSGSTGAPKGVMVAHRNVEAFAAAIGGVVGLEPDDRISQSAELTFDGSAQELYLAWGVGACVCCPSEGTLFRPGPFIDEARLTAWYAVPSVVLFMQRLGMLKPNRYPRLRIALLGGEQLLVDTAQAVRAAAPNAVLHNTYGPTEVTVTCTSYRWDDDRSPDECERGAVPIGDPLRGMEPLVVDDRLREVAPGVEGELLMAGPQVTLGYWHDPERTATAYVVPPGRRRTFYRTGDRVVRRAADAPIQYRGRRDDQLKVLGHRVELGEIEAALRSAAGLPDVAAIGWPPTPGGYGGIAAFVAGAVDASLVRRRVAELLPEYMVPRRLETVGSLPIGPTGKLDRDALARLLETVVPEARVGPDEPVG